MKSKNLASILLTMIDRGADVFFYSSFDAGICFLYKTSAGLLAEYFYRPDIWNPTGQVFAVTDIEEWVSLRKDDIESFLLRGRL